MGARRAAGLALTAVSLVVLVYVLYSGAVNGMIGCAKPVLQLQVETGKGVKVCSIAGSVACSSASLSAEKQRLAELGESVKGGQPPSECSVEGTVKGYKVVVTPVDSSVAVATVAAWMGLLVGPWLAFGERPSRIAPRAASRA